MRTIRQSSRFAKDVKREQAGRYRKALVEDLPSIISTLLSDEPLPFSVRDHALTGEWEGYRDCHVKPDLLLIYRKVNNELQLARLGSHSELNF